MELPSSNVSSNSERMIALYHCRFTLLLCFAVSTLSGFSVTAYIQEVKPETCGNANGELRAALSGSPVVQPLTYMWSTGATTESVTGAAGSYSVTITDGDGTEFTADAVLTNVSVLPTNYGPSFAADPFDLLGITGAACEGSCNGVLGMPMGDLGGTGPFSYSFDVSSTFLGMSSYGHPVYSGFCGLAEVNYTMTDALGCTGSGTFEVPEVTEEWNVWVDDVQGACDGSNIGTISIQPGLWQSYYEVTLLLNGVTIEGPFHLDWGVSHSCAGLGPGQYDLLVVPNSTQCQLSQYVTVPDLGPGCTQITGTSWYDADGDCALDLGEVGIPGSVLLIEPGSQYALTGTDGAYSFNLPTGNYTLAQTDADLVPYCPATVPVPFTVNATPVSIDLANNSTAPLNLRTHAYASNARPGFAHVIYGSASNATPRTTGLVTVVCTIDPAVDYVSATPTPLDVTGDVITWEVPELDYFGAQGFTVQTTVPVATPLGTLLTHTFSVTSVVADADLSDNSDQTARVVAGSYDPNDKTATTSTRSSDVFYFIAQDEWIDYTIRFQNTGTEEAYWVTVTDTLPGTLDMTTFQMGVASHANVVTFKPGRVVEWFFDNVNLPDSTSDEPGSHGFVKFRIKPSSLLPGTIITNVANIYFDLNPPVITEPSVLTAEFSTGLEESGATSLSLSPVPAADRLNIRSEEQIDAILLLSSDGREVMRRSLRTSSVSLDVAELKAGVYLLVATLNNGGVLRERFIKH